MDNTAMIKCPKCKNDVKIQPDGTVYCRLCGYVNNVRDLEKNKK